MTSPSKPQFPKVPESDSAGIRNLGAGSGADRAPGDATGLGSGHGTRLASGPTSDPAARLATGLTSDLSGLRIPLIAAPMLRISDVALTSAAMRAGIVGAFPTLNARSSAGLRDWLTELDAIQASASGLFCPNLVMADAHAAEHAALVAESSARLVITSVGSPAPVTGLFAEAGIAVLADVATVAHARKAVAAGATGLILLTAGAGGQTGWLNPFAFITAVREFFSGPVVLAGGMTGGRSLAAARVAGYDLAYAGTPFIATEESPASSDYSAEITAATSDDILLTSAFTGLPTNMLLPSIRAAGLDPAALDEEIRPEAAAELFGNRARGLGPRRWADIHSAGHSVAGVRSVMSVEALVARFAEEYAAARDRPI
ncbi:NAD(P)H-dependent flavin oxidoreductase [Brevibacterium ihuae]|uniref:NAD(P)H-dependent flavin oxidoreductase n=1 Tax=Brevibacterium ihuae TaxID=1631743 RepID=UPI001C6085A8|nr:nitronate monooxygenase [Brevibacterium ihuae]